MVELSTDPHLRSRAAVEHYEVVEHEREVDAHRKKRPPFWEVGWRPGRSAVTAYLLCGLTVIAWLVVSPAVLGYGFFVTVFVALVLAGFLWLAVLRAFLPSSVPDWQYWAVQYLVLLARIPRHRRRSRMTIRDDVVLPMTREWINRKKTPSYAVHLTLRDDSGLRQSSDTTPLVETSAIRSFLYHVTQGVPGAIGVAGRRGAGKSTLIDRALDVEVGQGLDLRGHYLMVQASAPMRYDSREFVLHLHAVTCRAVLDRCGTPRFARSRRSFYPGEIDDEMWMHAFRRAQAVSSAQGILWHLFVGFIAFVVAGGSLSLAAGSSDGSRMATHFVSTVQAFSSSAAQYIQSRPPATIILDLLAAVATVVVVAQALRIAGIILRMSMPPLIAGIRWWRAERRRTPHARALCSLARRHLRRIRFLQTRTEGWSGKLALPKPFGLGMSHSVQNAEQPLTQPEVVNQYRSFLAHTASAVRAMDVVGVIVAIDELDKIADSAAAQQFLNEIKGVFDVDGCAFVVSVSEDALTAFDRRGIPVRDAFESAFGTMVHVEPFTLDESRTWLARRALGIPEAFVCLCHCLSGGLPRELHRTAIALCDVVATEDQPPLDEVADAVVDADLRDKLRGFSIAAHQGATNAEVSRFLTVLNTAPTHLDVSTLFALYEQILPPTPHQVSSTLEQLQVEAATYLYFSATLLQVFTMDLTAEVLGPALEASADAPIEMLAKVRQYLALDPNLSHHLLTDFRKSWGLPEPDSLADEHP